MFKIFDKKTREPTVPVLWADRTYYDFDRIPSSEIPPGALDFEHEGEWTYLLEKAEDGTYRPFPLNLPKESDRDKNVEPSDLYQGTSFGELTDFMRADPEDDDPLRKWELYLFIGAVLVFGFLALLMFMG